MSSPRFRLTFSLKAQQDVDAILQYSLQEWGEEQHDRYAAALDRGFTVLLEFPNAGRARDDLRPGYRTYPVEQHVICYIVTSRTVRVVRVLHQRMDLSKVFSG